MQTTTLTTHPDEAPETAGEMLEETLELIDFVPVAGPPAVLVVAPLVLLSLIVAGPFLLLLTIVAGMAAAALLVALAGAVLASPYLLVRHLRGRRATTRESVGAPVPPLVAVQSQRSAA